jgi:hypothetical protein
VADYGADPPRWLAGCPLGGPAARPCHRFLVGFDLFVPAHYFVGYAAQTVGYYRGLLGLLPPAVAELIAHGNAERLAPFAAP